MSAFTVKISRPGRFGAQTAATLEMPATWAEFHDAMQKARIVDSRVIFSTTLLKTSYPCLLPHVPSQTNPYELNLLAHRLEECLGEDERKIFDSRVRMEEQKTSPISMPRLINLTFSLETPGKVDEVYKRGEMAFFERSGAPVVLAIAKDGPVTNNNMPVVLDLPANRVKLDRALTAVGAASLDECRYRCTDCLIPAAKTWIDNANDICQVIEYAEALHNLERTALPEPYKAALEAAGCADLEAAMLLIQDVLDYELFPEMIESTDYGWDYAEDLKGTGVSAQILKHLNYESYGKEMMEKDHAVITSYGIIRRKDRAPIQASEQSDPGLHLQM